MESCQPIKRFKDKKKKKKTKKKKKKEKKKKKRQPDKILSANYDAALSNEA